MKFLTGFPWSGNDGGYLSKWTPAIITEAGPTRSALLTGEGVAELLRQQAGVVDPQALVAGLMAGVDAYTGEGVRDDQCLLVAVVPET